MTKKTKENQPVEEKEGFIGGEGYPNCEGEPCANMADEEPKDADTVTEQQSEAAPQSDEPDWRDKYIRLQAEFDNFRKRTLREKMDLIQSGGSDVVKAILPVLDDMQRAVAAADKSDDIASLREGQRLVEKKFVDTLRQKNVVEIEAKEKPFDENLHEAVARFAAGEQMKGKVIDVVERGYMIGDKVLRFAKVVVGE
jgi:molecular chaperone GrpE